MLSVLSSARTKVTFGKITIRQLERLASTNETIQPYQPRPVYNPNLYTYHAHFLLFSFGFEFLRKTSLWKFGGGFWISTREIGAE